MSSLHAPPASHQGGVGGGGGPGAYRRPSPSGHRPGPYPSALPSSRSYLAPPHSAHRARVAPSRWVEDGDPYAAYPPPHDSYYPRRPSRPHPYDRTMRPDPYGPPPSRRPPPPDPHYYAEDGAAYPPRHQSRSHPSSRAPPAQPHDYRRGQTRHASPSRVPSRGPSPAVHSTSDQPGPQPRYTFPDPPSRSTDTGPPSRNGPAHPAEAPTSSTDQANKTPESVPRTQVKATKEGIEAEYTRMAKAQRENIEMQRQSRERPPPPPPHASREAHYPYDTEYYDYPPEPYHRRQPHDGYRYDPRGAHDPRARYSQGRLPARYPPHAHAPYPYASAADYSISERVAGHARRESMASIASTLRSNSARLFPNMGAGRPPPAHGSGPFGGASAIEGDAREALLREQGEAIKAARRALAASKKREALKERARLDELERIEREKEKVAVEKEDPARRRRVQLQVFVHARPTYCRWGSCRAVLNSWGLLEKHILHAHIKPLATPLDRATHDNAPEIVVPAETTKSPSLAVALVKATPKKTEFRCHWAECPKIFQDKDRMYRHCLVEHMGEFCARCPFDCLFEGPTFPSLMAHISRRHPNATPDDFVPGLIHFEPPVQTLPPIPIEEATIVPLASDATPIVLPFIRSSPAGEKADGLLPPPAAGVQKARTGSRAGLPKGYHQGISATLTKAERKDQRKTALDRKVAGRIILEVIRIARATAALQSNTSSIATTPIDSLSASQDTCLGDRKSEAANSDVSGANIPKIDVKAIAKRVRATIKLESFSNRTSASPFSPATSPTGGPKRQIQETLLPPEYTLDDGTAVVGGASGPVISGESGSSEGSDKFTEAPIVKSSSTKDEGGLVPSSYKGLKSVYVSPLMTTVDLINQVSSASPPSIKSKSETSSPTDSSDDSGSESDSPDYVPARSLALGALEVEPVVRPKRAPKERREVSGGDDHREASREDREVKGEGIAEEEMVSRPNTPDLKIRLKIFRLDTGVKRDLEEEGEDELTEDELKERARRLRPKRRR